MRHGRHATGRQWDIRSGSNPAQVCENACANSPGLSWSSSVSRRGAVSKHASKSSSPARKLQRVPLSMAGPATTAYVGAPARAGTPLAAAGIPASKGFIAAPA